ncbi:coiled-coil domain-containing protein 130-like [Acanthaster planci]|uniref:Coiled-coil domain-containing protein 130-like n=1 Tax=Acanthaster planci TaxID=133434 RepID=A0A8B7Z7X6_ACAPL|nr:coiled-coil domain-containing protein 130-like [Acanthaster planci]
MADRKATNRYYPPDFDPTKHGSINKYRNSHPLRERAKRLSEGILVIRFEMPYNIWCGGCGNHIGMGVRYNAEKTKVGNYYTTPIYRFRMKCHLCDNYIEMETNPMECDYTVVTGAYRKNQKWDMAENEQVLTEDRQTVKKLATDPMFKLEHGTDDTKKLEAVAPTLHELEQTQTTWKDDFELNRMLRQKFRKEKTELKTAVARDEALLSKSSLDIALVPEHDEDKKLASLMKYNTVETYDEKQKKKRQEISNRSIFSKSLSSSSSSTPASAMATTPPSQETSKQHRNSGAQKQFDLIHRLKAAKRTSAGFDDFGSCPDRKTARQSGGMGIVLSKRQKDTRNGEEKSPDPQEDRTRSDQEASKVVSPKLEAGSVPESEVTRDRVCTDQELKTCRTKCECICASAKQLGRSSEDGNGERTTTEHVATDCLKDINLEFSNRLQATERPHRQPNGFESGHQPRGDSKRTVGDCTAQTEVSPGKLTVGKGNATLVKSLVSCDYSSGDSDGSAD